MISMVKFNFDFLFKALNLEFHHFGNVQGSIH